MNWKAFLLFFARVTFELKFRLLGLLLVCMVLISLFIIFETPSYKTSWIMLLPGTERASTITLDNISEARTQGGSAYGSVSISPKNTYKEIALSDAVINAAAQEYGVVADAFSRPKITLIDQTPAMKFSLKGESQSELRFRAGLYNKIFHQTLDDLRNNEIESSFAGIEKKLKQAKQRLNQARQSIIEFQASNSIFSDKQFERWVSDAEELKKKVTMTNVSLAQHDALVKSSLAHLGISKSQAKSLQTLQANPLLSETASALSKQHAKQVSSKAFFAEAHPNRQSLRREVKSLASEVKSLLKGFPDLHEIPENQLHGLLAHSNIDAVNQINNQIAEQQGLLAKKEALDISYFSYQQRIKQASQHVARLADLQREHQIAEAIFSSALAKLDTSRLDVFATYPLTQLLTQPGATIKRDRLQAKLLILAALISYGLLSLSLIISRMRTILLTSTRNVASQNEFAASLSSSLV